MKSYTWKILIFSVLPTFFYFAGYIGDGIGLAIFVFTLVLYNYFARFFVKGLLADYFEPKVESYEKQRDRILKEGKVKGKFE